MVSAPAHCAYETRLIKMADANHRPLGSVETCNKRTINQFIHPEDVYKRQGLLCVDKGSSKGVLLGHDGVVVLKAVLGQHLLDLCEMCIRDRYSAL